MICDTNIVPSKRIFTLAVLTGHHIMPWISRCIHRCGGVKEAGVVWRPGILGLCCDRYSILYTLTLYVYRHAYTDMSLKYNVNAVSPKPNRWSSAQGGAFEPKETRPAYIVHNIITLELCEPHVRIWRYIIIVIYFYCGARGGALIQLVFRHTQKGQVPVRQSPQCRTLTHILCARA